MRVEVVVVVVRTGRSLAEFFLEGRKTFEFSPLLLSSHDLL